jgi:hypothetical protein
LGLLTLACLVLLALPGGALAEPGAPAGAATEACPIRHIVLDVSYYCTAEFTLRASDGYRITVSGEAGNGPDDVELSARRGNEDVEYNARGTVTATGIEASFGRLGKVSLRFLPSGVVRRVRVAKTCVKSRPPVVSAQLGSFVGTIRFRGEGGYTKVRADRANGGLGDPLAIAPKLKCEAGLKSEKRQEAGVVRLTASDLAPHGGIYFEAWASPLSRLALLTGPSTPQDDAYTFIVFAVEKKERMIIFRAAVAPGPAGDFVFDSALSSATVIPPVPFSGSGSFQRDADGTIAWTGDLAVALPGRGSVPLAGPGLRATLSSNSSEFFSE